MPKILDFSYKKYENLPFGSVILAGGSAFQCTGMQDQKKVWEIVGSTGRFTTASILDVVRQQKLEIQVLWTPL